MRVLVVCSLLAVFGCHRGAEATRPTVIGDGTNHPGARPERVDPVWRATAQQYLPTLVDQFCNGRPSVPSFHMKTHFGATVRQPCGLIATELGAPEAYDGFAALRCTQIDASACRSAFARMFYARIRERYPYADFAAVANHCDAYPNECDDFVTYEDAFVRSHNAAVVAVWDHDAEQRFAARATEAAEQRAARRHVWSEAFRALGEGMQRPQAQTVNCVSRTNSFGTTHTRCE